MTVETAGAAEAIDCKWGARGINADVLHQLDDARTHAADEDEALDGDDRRVRRRALVRRPARARRRHRTTARDSIVDRDARSAGGPVSAPETAPAAPLDDGRSSWQTTYRVRFDEAGPDGVLRTSGFMRYAQDLAWQHSAELGFGRAWYAERGLTWLVRAAELVDHTRRPRWARRSPLGPRSSGIRRVFARRRGEFRLADGTPAGWVHTDWVLIDARGALTRIPPIFPEMFGGAELMGSVGRIPLPPTPADAVHRRVRCPAPRARPDGPRRTTRSISTGSRRAIVAAAEPADGCRDLGLPRRYRMEFALAAEAGVPARRRGLARTTTAGATGCRRSTDGADRSGRPGRRPATAASPRGTRRTNDADGAAPAAGCSTAPGSDPGRADVAIEDGRIVEVGTGLDGDEEVDVPGRTILPGLFDCHVHVCISNVDLWGSVQQPFSLPVLRGGEEPPEDARDRDHVGPRRGRRRPRDQGRPSSDGTDRRVRGCRSRSSCSARPAATATTGSRPGAEVPFMGAASRPAVRDRRRPRRDPPQGPRAPSATAPT